MTEERKIDPDQFQLGQVLTCNQDHKWICIGRCRKEYWHFATVINDEYKGGPIWEYRAKYADTLAKKFPESAPMTPALVEAVDECIGYQRMGGLDDTVIRDVAHDHDVEFDQLKAILGGE
jgi:hypothetical protein